MADHDEIWAEALQEAYAAAPTDEVILHTLELRHPAFADSAIRVVLDHGDSYVVEGDGNSITASLDAPVGGGVTAAGTNSSINTRVAMEAGMIWNGVLTFAFGLLGWVLRNYVDSLDFLLL